MSINLDLLLELKNQLTTEASKLNLPLSEYIPRILSMRQVLSHPPQTGTEIVA